MEKPLHVSVAEVLGAEVEWRVPDWYKNIPGHSDDFCWMRRLHAGDRIRTQETHFGGGTVVRVIQEGEDLWGDTFPRFDTDWSATGVVLETMLKDGHRDFHLSPPYDTGEGWHAVWGPRVGRGATIQEAICYLLLSIHAAGELESGALPRSRVSSGNESRAANDLAARVFPTPGGPTRRAERVGSTPAADNASSNWRS